MKNTRRAEKITAHLTAICALATEIEESPSIMGGDDIERLCELHQHAEAAIKLLKQEQQRSERKMSDIEVKWEGPGEYWFISADKQHQIGLGYCVSEAEAIQDARRAIEAGSGNEDWTDWFVAQ